MEKLMRPKNLKIQKLIERFSIEHIAGFHKDKIYFVCHGIYSQMMKLNNKNIYRGKDEAYSVPLKGEILRSAVGNNYIEYLNWMIKVGVIQRDNRYERGRISMGYRFTDHYLNSGIRWATVTCEKIRRHEHRITENRDFVYMPRVVQRLKRFFDAERLKIDSKSANEVVSVFKNEYKVTQKNANKLRLKIANYRSSIRAIVTGKFRINQDNFGYRIFTPITKLSKKFRPFVTFDGKKLVEFDIAGSQLFFSLFLLNQNNWINTKYCRKTSEVKQIWKDISIINSKTYGNTIMIINNSETQYGKGFQKHRFFQDCIEGRVYDVIAEQIGYSRKKVKMILLKQLFADPTKPEHAMLYNGENRPILACFQTLYPEVTEVFAQIRNGHYKDLCKLLQRIESTAMLRVCKFLQQHHPDVPIFTLHDCIVTTFGNELLVEQAMAKCIKDFIGFAPTIEKKCWTDMKDDQQQLMLKFAA